VVIAREPPRKVVGGGQQRNDQLLELEGCFVRIRLAQETPPSKKTAGAVILFPIFRRLPGNSSAGAEVSSSNGGNMKLETDRREFLKLAGLGGGVVFASSLWRGALAGSTEEFHFVQLSDTHWGFEGAPNPDAKGTLPKAIAAVNALSQQPDFVVFTGDLTHTTDDGVKRRDRMKQFRDIAGKLRAKTVRFLPGEHDAALDRGEAYQELFGATHYSFDHKGVHFSVLDNVSDPGAAVGEAQLAWLKGDLAKLKPEAPIAVLTHRPLFDLYPSWDWATKDGAATLEILQPFKHVTVFYGHIHQEHHHKTGHIEHHAATSLIFPLPAPGSVPKRAPVPWDETQPYRGLGWREVEAYPEAGSFRADEKPLNAAAAATKAGLEGMLG
jgi:Calcineurin-like phosphoesterase